LKEVISVKTLTVALGDRSYPIYLGEGILDRLPTLLVEASIRGAAIVVTDANVGPLYGERVASLLGSGTAVCALPAARNRNGLTGSNGCVGVSSKRGSIAAA